MSSFGEFLYTLRKEKGMTQAELAEALGVTNKAVSKWETGEAMPETGQLVPLSRIFGVTVDELLNGERVAEPAEEIPEEHAEYKEPDNEILADEIKKHLFTRGRDDEKTLLEVICGAVCAAIMGLGTLSYLLLGLLAGLWSSTWVIFPVCGLGCGIVGIVFDMCNRKKREWKRSRGENPYTGAACGIIMLTCVAVYLLLGALLGLWHPYWVIIVAGGLACGVVGAVGEILVYRKKKK